MKDTRIRKILLAVGLIVLVTIGGSLLFPPIQGDWVHFPYRGGYEFYRFRNGKIIRYVLWPQVNDNNGRVVKSASVESEDIGTYGNRKWNTFETRIPGMGNVTLVNTLHIGPIWIYGDLLQKHGRDLMFRRMFAPLKNAQVVAEATTKTNKDTAQQSSGGDVDPAKRGTTSPDGASASQK
ncbi:MAG: hypothetical protein PHR77_16585 [Kiritimatiellae bacterium]|nr:hypothetical protein [Kiritimatiellia bacterium]MDD5521616.1 hypothetical protein [Kiritimatiellia bacterium]